ncbi:MAG: glycosyltransferase family 2 protein [SAR324 cluster bacterium]|nr:glycosyltransferase family 2 protein [SAR324 cluster bacterium]
MKNVLSDKIDPRILIMIPCYNEEASIGAVLKEIQSMKLGYDTIVIDDGSVDKTSQNAAVLSPCIKLVANLGIGGAVQTAIKYSLENNYDLCIQLDGDGQHPPDQILVLLENYSEASANLLVGSRFMAESSFRSTSMRRFGIQILCKMIQWIYRKTITDPTSGFRLMDKTAMRLFCTHYPMDFPEPISLAIAFEEGLVVREVPVSMKPRKKGTSSITGFKTVAYMMRVIGYLFLIRIGRYV